MRDEAIPALFQALGAAGAIETLPILFGHSMGGAMALDYALAHPATIAAVVASAPGLRAAPPPWWKAAAAQVLGVIAPGLGIPHGLPIDGVSRDRETVTLYRNDPLVHGVISARLYAGIGAAQARVLSRAATLAVPALVLAGTADTVVDSSGATEFAAAAPRDTARFVSLPGAYHEILNDVGRDAVSATIVAWLAGLPRAAR